MTEHIVHHNTIKQVSGTVYIRHWKIRPIYRLYKMFVDPEFTDFVPFLIINRMSINTFYKHFV